VYALGGVVFAVPFDLKRLEVTGGPIPILEGVRRASVGPTPGTAQFSFSDTGSLIYIPGPTGTRTTERAVALADRAGVVTRLTVPAGPYAHIRVSRDGTRLAVGSDDGKEAIVWIYRLGGASAMQRLTIGGKNRFPIWSADGQRVAFQSDREGDLAIFWQRADGTGPVERLTRPEQGEAHVPESWSPDGRHVSFSVAKGSGFSLWTLSVEDKKATPYGGVRSGEPIGSAFSPDGQWIAYSSNAPGARFFSSNGGVYIQPFPATGAIYQVPKKGRDFHPVWAADGAALIYVPTAASGQLAAVSVTTRPGVTFGSPVSLPARVTADRISSEMRAYDILPDGRFIGLVNSSEPESSRAAAPEILVVLNWFEELKARVPTK
jgi:dipeptidyl aminopeptidase/acylaminoacyl peptidase